MAHGDYSPVGLVAAVLRTLAASAGAYLGENATHLGSLIALDTLRGVLIAGIVLATALLVNQPVVDAINRFLNSGGR